MIISLSEKELEIMKIFKKNVRNDETRNDDVGF